MIFPYFRFYNPSFPETSFRSSISALEGSPLSPLQISATFNSMALLTQTDDIRRVLQTSKTVAVLGAHTNERKAAYYVPRYLDDNGYTVYPVNPVFEGKTLFGSLVVADLSELNKPVDVVNVFRRSEHLPAHLPEILALEPLPKTVWLQLGVRHEAVAKELVDAGVDVIQNRCMLADHQRLL